MELKILVFVDFFSFVFVYNLGFGGLPMVIWYRSGEGLDLWSGFGGAKMSSLSRELVFLILQFLDEEKFKETVHKYGKIFSIFPYLSLLRLTLIFSKFREVLLNWFVTYYYFFLGCGDWSKNQVFSLTWGILRKRWPMVSGMTLRSICQDSRRLMIIDTLWRYFLRSENKSIWKP